MHSSPEAFENNSLCKSWGNRGCLPFTKSDSGKSGWTKYGQPRSQGSILPAPRSSVERVGENPGSEVEVWLDMIRHPLV